MMDEPLTESTHETHSSTRMLWMRMFADCRHNLKRLLWCIVIVGFTIAVMFFVNFYSEVFVDGRLASMYGIRPWHAYTLWPGAFVWPFLHFGWPHFLGNAPFLFILGFLVCIRGIVDFIVVWLFAQFIGAFGIFLTGSYNSVHAGASGVITGFFGCLLLRVVFERSLVSLVWAAVVAVFYGSLFYVLIPSNAYSWQGHLFGFLGGVAAAALLGVLHRRRAQRLVQQHNAIGSDNTELTRFDDFQLETNLDRLADEDAMMKEVQSQLARQ